MDELKELGIENNTLVVMMADNGPMTHNGPPGMCYLPSYFQGGLGFRV